MTEFPKPNLFVVWLSWRGKDPGLKTILLNSHMDVVPVEPVIRKLMTKRLITLANWLKSNTISVLY
jgi:hypothetical protein